MIILSPDRIFIPALKLSIDRRTCSAEAEQVLPRKMKGYFLA